MLLSALGMGDPGGGLGFHLANRHHPTLIPMISWTRKPTPGAVARQSAPSLIAALRQRLRLHADDDLGRMHPEEAYARVATMLDLSTLIEMETERQVPIRIEERYIDQQPSDSAAVACKPCDDEERLSSDLQRM